MRYIQLKGRTANSKPKNNLKELLLSTPAKVATGLLLFLLVMLFFVFGGSNNFFFARQGFNQFSGRTNILLLGTGGEGHAGINLADTIILASVDFSKKDVAFVPIPRDLWLEDLGAKVNNIYAAGEEKKKDNGLAFTKEKIERVIGIPIHYGVRVDFTGFTQAIDLIGGIDVEVTKSFEDFIYPIAGREEDTCGLTISEVEVDGVKKIQVFDATGAAVLESDPFTCRYERIAFKAGLQHMDGATALKFVRSRMGTNGAGSDFDRSRRQKQVILAEVKKVFDLRNLFSPKKIAELITTFDQNIDTDFQEREFSQIPVLLSQINEFDFRSLVLSPEGDNPLLYNPPVSRFGSWVLLPKDDNWNNLAKAIQDFIFEEPRTS